MFLVFIRLQGYIKTQNYANNIFIVKYIKNKKERRFEARREGKKEWKKGGVGKKTGEKQSKGKEGRKGKRREKGSVVG